MITFEVRPSGRNQQITMKNTKPKKKEQPTLTDVEKQKLMPLTFTNYRLMLIGFAVIVLGFVLMAGGGSHDPNVYNEQTLFSWRRITLAPLLVLGGFFFEIYAIMHRPRKEE